MRNIIAGNPFSCLLKVLTGLVLICTAAACSKDQAALNPDLPVSRLLVSNAITDSVSNGISLYNHADVVPLGNESGFNMQNPFPTGIIYDQMDNRGFQFGTLSKTIKSFSVNTDGTLRFLNSFTDTLITDGRALAYNYFNKSLYITSTADSTLLVYANANTKIGSANSSDSIKLSAKPFGIFYGKGRVMLVMGEDRQILVSEPSVLDSAASNAQSLIVNEAVLLSGIWYDADRDLLFLTDLGDQANASDGAILIIEGATAKIAAGGTVSPDRKISGASTFLGNPVGVAFDGRAGKDIIYVAEKANKKVLAFQFSDDGNAAPFINVDRNQAPEAIWLDAR